MAYLQSNPPRNQRSVLRINDFSGGINNVDTRIAPNQLRDMVNMEFHETYGLRRRRGTRYDVSISGVATLGDTINHLDNYEQIAGTHVQVISVQDEHNFMLSDGYGSAQGNVYPGRIYDGTTYKNFYVYSQDDGMYVCGSTKAFPFPNTYVEWVGSIPRQFTRLKIVAPPSSYTPLDKNHTRGKTKFDFVNGTVTYMPCELELADPYKGVNSPPSEARYISQLNGRIYCGGTSSDDSNDTIYITDVGNPFYFPPAMNLQLPPNSDKIVGLREYDDGVVVFRNHDVHILRGITNNPSLGLDMYKVQQLNTPTGMMLPKCFDRSNTYLFYVGSDYNVYAITSTTATDKRLNVQIINKTVDLKKEPFNLKPPGAVSVLPDLQGCIYHNDKFYIMAGSQTIVYDFKQMAWYRHIGMDMIAATVRLDNQLVVGRSNGNLVLLASDDEDVFTDNGSVYTSSFKTDKFHAGTEFYEKIFKFGHFITELSDPEAAGYFKFTFDDQYSTTFDSYGDVYGIFGKSKFGTSRFWQRDKFVSDRFSLNRRAREFDIEFKCGYIVDPNHENIGVNDKQVIIYEIDIEYEQRGRN